MTLAPLLDANPAIQVHAFAAMSAFALGVVQLAAPKGSLPHRTLGWIWVTLMLIVSISAFFIHQSGCGESGARSIFSQYSRCLCCRSVC
jgi:uncharacterized membrane protein